VILVFINGDPMANNSEQPLAGNSELITNGNLSEIIDSLFLNSIWSF